MHKCDFSHENIHYGYLFECLKTVRLLFAIRLSSIRDRWDAIQTDWIICSEKILVIWTAAAICSKKIFIRLNSWGYLFEKNLHLFEQLRLAVQ